MAVQGNMSFAATNFRGTGKCEAVPVWNHQLPLTIGGVIGPLADDVVAAFGRLVSIDPRAPRQLLVGNPTGSIPKGILVYDESISQLDPAMNNRYFEGRPATALTFGLVQFTDFDIALKPPVEGMRVVANKIDGRIGFVAVGDTVTGDWIELNGYVYEKQDPNGVTLFLGASGSIAKVAPASEIPVQVSPVVPSTAAGAVAAGTQITLTSGTPGAQILYTVDGTTPTSNSPKYTVPIVVSAAVTIKAVAVFDGMAPSIILSADYTIA